MEQKTLRLVLGDQLNHSHSWWNDHPESYTVLMAETLSETGYVKHHIQKVIAFFLAMRSFAERLRERGIEVRYLKLDDPANRQSIPDNIKYMLSEGGHSSWAYQLPDEYRLDQELRTLADTLVVPCEVASTEHFLSERDDLKNHFKDRKMYLMESFYRMMRKRENVLMDGAEPVLGKWNFDHENRKSLPDGVKVPRPIEFNRNVEELVEMLSGMRVETIGRVHAENFIWPVSREESLQLLDWFTDHCLVLFGAYQDAMAKGQWSLFHSRLSFAMNIKLLHPREVINKVEHAWRRNPDAIPISSAEGFIRQILGWREYMRGVYWAQMPGYASLNHFGHDNKLPAWFWTGETKMNCLKQVVNQSLDHAYAHHIQRLMITGNFALLAGIDPSAVDEWYLGVYIDAIEWVEITNTRGMSQYADGGIVGTKPYVSSANYIDKMSDYCKGCYYRKEEKTVERACPFNSLFWHFYHRHRKLLENNPRIGFVYRTLDKMNPDSLKSILQRAEYVIGACDEL